MKKSLQVILSFLVLAAAFAVTVESRTADSGVTVRMTVTANVTDSENVPEIPPNDVIVERGHERLKVTEWSPARGDRAGLELFILIDDACDPSLGSHLHELRTFVKDQPPATSVAIGYMRNATVQIAQNFTTDHAAAAKAIRLPPGTPGAYGSPYLSVIDLIKRWPASSNRREVLMISDGIDRARSAPRWRGLSMNPDVDGASSAAQRAGIMVHAIYSPGTGRQRRNFWEATNGQMGIAKLAEETGGESFYLGLQNPVSFEPYLKELEQALSSQYLLSFSAMPGTRSGPQYVSLHTEVAGVEFAAADSVWVPAR